MPTRRRSTRHKSGGKSYAEDDDDSSYSPRISGRGSNSTVLGLTGQVPEMSSGLKVKFPDMKGRPSGYGLRQRRPEDTVELMMECEEEDLLPAQIQAFKHDMEEFEAAKRKIKAAKDDQIRLQQEQIRLQQQQLIRQQQVVTVAQQKAVAPASAPQPDVIIVGESPPKQLPTSQPAQPTISTGARMVNPTPQQVYKFVNLPGQTLSNTASGNQWVIRPLMQVMPQQNSVNKIQPRLPQQTISIMKSPYLPKQTGISSPFQQTQSVLASSLAAKRPMQYNMIQQQQYVSPPKKKRKPEDDVGALVPLDEYYYGKKEGDPTFVEDKAEHRFKCWYCSKMLYNNVKTMMHMQGHIDSEKQQNLDLSDLTQCKHCYKQFDTPFEMQTHIEKVHMNNANVLLCRICEKDHESRQTLTNHMRQNHNACEMPYICQLCHFRSSMYSDVVDHFKKKHEHAACVLCLYCLKVFHIKFVSQGWGQTQNYYHHLLRHQSKTNAKKCQLCKLTFFNVQEVKAHRKRDHMPNQKGVIGMNAKYSTPDQVMIRVPESGLQPKQQGVKSLNAPAVSKVSEHRGLLFPWRVQELHCFECKMLMATNDHYKKYIQCSMCRFATSCGFAYANHMMGFHSGQITSLSLNIPWERPLPHPMYCLCGFGSKYGNKIANHLVFCTKRSCYKEKPIPPPKEDKVDEEQDPRRKPGASLLDVLGLVKKPNIVSNKRFLSPPRERTPSPEPSTSQESDIPSELTGAQRWLTVKLKDDQTPTKAAVFGTEDTGDRPFTPEPDDGSREGGEIDSIVKAALADTEDKEEPSEKDREDMKETRDKEDEDMEEDNVNKDTEGDKSIEDDKESDIMKSTNDKEEGAESTVMDGNTEDKDSDKDSDMDNAEECVEDMDSSVQESDKKVSGGDEDVHSAEKRSEETSESVAETEADSMDVDKDVVGKKAETQQEDETVSEKAEEQLEESVNEDDVSSKQTTSEPCVEESKEDGEEKDDEHSLGEDKDISETQPESETCGVESETLSQPERSEKSTSQDTSSERPEESEQRVTDSSDMVSEKPSESASGTAETSIEKPEESEMPSSELEGEGAMSKAPEKAETGGERWQQPEDKLTASSSEDPTHKTKESPVAAKGSDTASRDRYSSSDQHSSPDKYSQDRSHGRSRDSDRERERYRDRSDDRDGERSHDRDRDRLHDHERSHDRAYDRDRDRREQHRSDRDRHGNYGNRDRYDDRRYQGDNRNYNRYQGSSHQREYGGYQGNQSYHQGDHRGNYGNQRDRYGHNNRGQGYHGNRDYRGRGQGYRGNY